MSDNRCPRQDFPSRCIVDGPTDPYHLGCGIAYYDDGRTLHDSLIVSLLRKRRGRVQPNWREKHG